MTMKAKDMAVHSGVFRLLSSKSLTMLSDDAFFHEASWKTWHNCHRLLWQQTWSPPFCACTITQVPCNPAPSAFFFFFFLWALAPRMVQLVCAVCAWNILSSSQAIIQTVACRYWGTGYLTSPQSFFLLPLYNIWDAVQQSSNRYRTLFVKDTDPDVYDGIDNCDIFKSSLLLVLISICSLACSVVGDLYSMFNKWLTFNNF